MAYGSDPTEGWQSQRNASDGGDSDAWRDVPDIEVVAILAVAIPFYFLFATRGDDLRGFAAALSIGVVLGETSLLRTFIRQVRFWTVLLGICLAHGVLVYLLPDGGEVRFGFAFAPLVILDLYACAKLITMICRSGMASDSSTKA